MRKTLMLAAAMVAMTGAAYAHDVKDNPFRADNDNQIGTSTPYHPGTPVLKEDADGQIGANFATTWPEAEHAAVKDAQAGQAAETYAISQTHPDPIAGEKVKQEVLTQKQP